MALSSHKHIAPGIVLGILLAAPATAGSLTVARCNLLTDGAFRPALVVDRDGVRAIHQIGEDGLTRTIAFTPEAALDWVGQLYGVRADSFRDCGGGGDDHGDRRPRPAAPDPDDDDDDDDDDGGGCGGGDCGGGDTA
ncbi:MAG: hypothetical protein IAE87_19775 [Rhodobacteraceae bacterium]|nr:hypothetical protein [Paracoccaceae bacterium]